MQKKSPAKKKSVAQKKRRTARKSRKPKVTLAKNKVAVLCAVISAVCVLAVGLSIALSVRNVGERPVAAQTAQNEQKKTERTEQTRTAQAQARTAETPVVRQQEQVAQTQDRPNASQQKKAETAAAKNEAESATAKSVTAKSAGNQNQAKEAAETRRMPAGKTETPPAVTTIPSNQPAKSAAARTSAASQAKSPSGEARPHTASAKTPREDEIIQQNVERDRFGIPPAANGATIVIIIDDAGRSVENTKRYAALPFPITIAVLPKQPQSRACADAVRAAGKEVILHQPMQAENLALDPGPGKITAEMTTYEIARTIKENLAELGPGVRGMNNHEGSLITANEIKIGAVLDVCDETGVYFLDSRTTAATKAPQAALERDIRIFEKAGPYLDNDIDRAKMIERIRETLAYANRNGRAIVIGHVDKSVRILPDLLAEMYPEMRAAGYRFATPGMLR